MVVEAVVEVSSLANTGRTLDFLWRRVVELLMGHGGSLGHAAVSAHFCG
jgi:hypothetical protein